MAEKDYSHFEKEELIGIIRKLESRKKYGLVWDEESVREQFETDSENSLPVLKRIKSKEIGDDEAGKTNILIEGDNYHALSVLNFTHQAKIDVIYIDPPYNTGARDWKYNNDYVDSHDSFRHSKWISFMNKRLRLAKNLLTEEGILICAIDDNEFANLKMLLEEIFPNHTHEIIVINHHPQGSGGANVSATHEYAIVSVPKGCHLFLGPPLDEIVEGWSLIKAGAGDDYYRTGRPRMFFAIHVDKKTGQALEIGPELSVTDRYPTSDTKEGLRRVYPLDSRGQERRWRYGRETMSELIKQKRILASLPSFSMKVLVPRAGSYKPVYSNWVDSRYNAGTHGTTLLKRILQDSDFPFPKSLYTLIDLLAAATRLKPDSTVLDYFAGSGTTGHAVLELNLRDGGERSFILCTNNENNICEDVTYPRIKKVITGYKDANDEAVSGYGGKLRYFKTGFVRNSLSKDDLKLRLSRECTEMLCLREGVFDLKEKTSDYEIYSEEGKTVAIYHSLDRGALKTLQKALNKIPAPKVLYCFTLDLLGLTQSDFIGWGDVVLEPIPQKILDVYRQIYEY